MIELLYKVEIFFDENAYYFDGDGDSVYKQLTDWLKEQPINMGFQVHEYANARYPYVECFCKNISQAREWEERLRTKIKEFGGTLIREEDEDEPIDN